MLFQAGKNKVLSLLDARSNKYYLAVYDHFKVLENIKLVTEDELQSYFDKYSEFKIVKDYDIDFINNYLETKEIFELVEDVNNINPLYVKSFV
ncbi:Uncharacterised protein [Mycoplasma putrefaciens]|nr:Uncharacterised protein [Mycoplasma putrefaciens]